MAIPYFEQDHVVLQVRNYLETTTMVSSNQLQVSRKAKTIFLKTIGFGIWGMCYGTEGMCYGTEDSKNGKYSAATNN